MMFDMKGNFELGVDEVGRGPLAGPVCVGVFLCTDKCKKKIATFSYKLKDSKKLSSLMREKWFTEIALWKKEGIVDFAVSFVDASIIDKKGISFSISKAITLCLQKLKKRNHFSFKVPILLDGGLKAPASYSTQKTIIKGDEKEIAIALASVVAKVSRDRLMNVYAKKYPKYHFNEHKGYGTKKHFEKIKLHGLSPIHRKTFITI